MRQRVTTALVLAPIVLAVVACSAPWPVFALCALALAACVSESRKLLSERALSLLPVLAFLCLGYFLVSRSFPVSSLVVIAAFLSFLGFVTSYLSVKGFGPKSLWWIFTAFWSAGPLFCLLAVHQHHAGEAFWRPASPLLLVLLPVWAGDTAAIFAGKAFGKHKMAPTISPNKTWEGSIGYFVASVLLGVGTASLLGMTPSVGGLCGLAAGILGQAGDLFESFIKRTAGVKDSGDLLPGHGGMLDRIDSLLFVAPVVALILVFGAR